MFKRFLLFIPILLLSAQVAAQFDEELLPPEQAFAFDATVTGSDLIMSWTIADGYYMYRDKFVVVSKSSPVSVGGLIFPQGEMIDDPLFGDVEIFTKFVQIRAPIAARRAVESAEFDVVGQGCNKPIGICYPPIQYALNLTGSELAGINIIPAAFASNDTGNDSPVMRSDAISDNNFSVQAEDLNGQSIRVSIKAEDGYYVRRNSVLFNLDGEAIITAIEMPYGDRVDSLNPEGTERYLSDFESLVQLTRSTPSPSSVKFTVRFEGTPADEANYTVITQSFDLNLPELLSEPVTLSSASPSSASDMATDSSWIWLIVSAFGAGLLLTFTPCVLPMIPILSSIIAGQGEATGKLRGGALAGVYVAGTVVSYGFIGGVAGATGDQLSAFFQNAWAIGALVTIFVLMALSMFGLYELRLPSALETRLHDRSARLGGGTAGAVFVLGMFSALIVSACVSPLLISALSIAIARADPVLGATMMMSLALGMGVILILIGFGLGITLPKAGPWMDRIKQVFGVMLLGVAIYLVGFIPEVPVLILCAVLFIICGVFLGATQRLPDGVSGWRYLWKGTGTVILLWGVLALIGGFYGNRNILQPLPGPQVLTGFISDRSGDSASAYEVQKPFKLVTSAQEFNYQVDLAEQREVPVVLDFYANWCLDCIRMDNSTYRNPSVVSMLRENHVSLKIDVTNPNDPFSRDIRRQFGVFGPPALVKWNPADEMSERSVRYGYFEPESLLDFLKTS